MKAGNGVTNMLKRYAVAIILPILGLVIVVYLSQRLGDIIAPPLDSTIAQPANVVAVPAPSPEQLAKPHLEWAEKECERAIEEQLAVLDEFFIESKKKTPAFAQEALSWSSQWRLVVDYVPYTEGGRHEKFLRGKFDELVFSSQDLQVVVTNVVAAYLQQVKSIEGQMLVRIRADVADFPSQYKMAQIDSSQLELSYAELVGVSAGATKGVVEGEAANVLASIAIEKSLMCAARAFGVRSPFLAVGAATSLPTLGISVVLGLIIDQIVSYAWDWCFDPEGSLTDELNTKIGEVNLLIVDGTAEGIGIRKQLSQFASERSTHRHQVILSLLQQP